MLILGFAGQAGCGKNTVADYLVRRYGFIQFAFSDALYAEVQAAFGLENQDLLRDRATKEVPALLLKNCTDEAFNEVAIAQLDAESEAGNYDKVLYPWGVPLRPRQILQWWGTEYRRAQDPNYWVKRAVERVMRIHAFPPYPELRPALFVETGTRFENEREWIKSDVGNIWHIHRDATDQMTDPHASAQPLPILPGEREIWNNSSIEHLHQAVDLLLTTAARFVQCEPMEERPAPPPADDAHVAVGSSLFSDPRKLKEA